MSTTSNTSNDIVYVQATQEIVTGSAAIPAGSAGVDQNVATDALITTLPKIEAGDLGLTYLFRNTGADGNNTLTLSPNAADAIHGTIANAAADSVAGGVVDKDFINTKATANKGDYVVLRAVALTEWYIIGGVGIWASEA
tara:strand:- start:4223 stop:4642 length:420 start_codon:yes stop_codon:yes gene_type:complete